MTDGPKTYCYSVCPNRCDANICAFSHLSRQPPLAKQHWLLFDLKPAAGTAGSGLAAPACDTRARGGKCDCNCSHARVMCRITEHRQEHHCTGIHTYGHRAVYRRSRRVHQRGNRLTRAASAPAMTGGSPVPETDSSTGDHSVKQVPVSVVYAGKSLVQCQQLHRLEH